MRYILIFLILSFSACAWALEIKSDAFEEGGNIQAQYTCDADNISVPLNWSNAPSGTKSFVLICDDPDSPSKSWTHWVIFNIPADKINLPRDLPKIGTFNDGTIQGVNDFSQIGYGGPCPPRGRPHRYFFKLYALDTILPLDKTSDKETVLEAMEGHIVAQAQTLGIYERR